MTMLVSPGAEPALPQFECRVWAYRDVLRPAPRKPGGFASPRKAQITAGGQNILTLSIPRWKPREIALAEEESFAHQVLSARRQVMVKALELLAVGAGTGVAVVIALFLMPRGTNDLAMVDVLTNILVAFSLGLATVFIVGLLWSIPGLLRMRTVDLFTLKRQDGRLWDVGVALPQSAAVVQLLESWGLRDAAAVRPSTG